MRRNRLLESLLQTGARLIDSHLISKELKSVGRVQEVAEVAVKGRKQT